MTTPIIPDTLRDEFYCNQAKAKIQAAVAARDSEKYIVKTGLIWSAGLLVLFSLLDFSSGRPFAGGWLYTWPLVPLLLALGVRFWPKARVSPEVEREEARLAAIFAEEERAREAHYHQEVLTKYRETSAQK